MENNQEYPICMCTEIGQGRQIGQGCMVPIKHIWTGSAIIADICTNCGHILSMRVEKPKKFKTKK
ncbi:hypothetical protein [Clostridium pasteurianum]|uniref:Uncharacterized protein n=1 Tax=Clostridium pasteurianum BC1 TaxID=86416 RepID=R4K792_CLOPA|nr:hypothetical protein [Clostridium pasteurianum]AGK96409.1 hypothetical protein Clopa_1434 [Clostridium pasteurianum BC1]